MAIIFTIVLMLEFFFFFLPMTIAAIDLFENSQMKSKAVSVKNITFNETCIKL